MEREAENAAMREALQSALQSHVRLGKAYRCDCSLCVQIRDSLEEGAGLRYADRIREECAAIADWRVEQLVTEMRTAPESEVPRLRMMQKIAREIGDRIRSLKGRTF